MKRRKISGLREELISTSAYWRVEIRDEVESTQSELTLLGEDLEGLVVVAEYQSKGRGRLDRSFDSEKYLALTFSFLLKPERDVSEWSWLSLLIGSSTVEAINQLNRENSIEIKVYSKWPNDIVTRDGFKIGGILLEQRDAYLIAGIGINVHHQADQLPVAHATSLDLLTEGINEREILLSRILKKIEDRYIQWKEFGLLPSEKLKYEESSSTLGSNVVALLPDGRKISGKALAIDQNGSLQIETVDGVEQVSAGDIIHAFGNTQIR